MADTDLNAKQMLDILRAIRPMATPCSSTLRDWWDNTALPPLKDQLLSELRRNDGFPPRIVGFMQGGDMGIVDIPQAMDDKWGSARSKDATAFIHKIAAMVPGTHASVFCAESWGLKANSKGELDRQRDKYPDMGDHPDSHELVMLQMLHYERATNQMMQLSTMIEVIKVLGQRTRLSWQHTEFGDMITTDPLDVKMSGRFIFSDHDDPS